MLLAMALLAPVGDRGSRVWAESVGQSFEGVEIAASKGQYRVASEALDQLADAVDQMPLVEQVKFWNLRADVDFSSGQFAAAERAALAHLALVRSEGRSSSTRKSIAERDSMVRLARIKRSWCEGRFGGDASREDLHRLEEVRSLLEASLQIPSTDKAAELLREADARYQLAETLAWLGQMDRARQEFSATSKSALAALEAYDGLKDQEKVSPAYLRGIAIVRQSYFAGDKRGPPDTESAARQATLAAGLIQKRLQRKDLDRSARVGLLAAAANCSRQLGDALTEERFLNDALQLADTSTYAEKSVRAEILVRLAELNDSESDAQRQVRCDAYYRESATLYSELLAAVQLALRDDTGGEQDVNPGEESQYLLQLQLIHTRLENWDQAIAAASGLCKLRRSTSLPEKDPNVFRAETALGSLHAKAARSARNRRDGSEPDFSDSRAHIGKAIEHLQLATEFWRDYRPRMDQELANALNYYAEMLRYNGDFRAADRLLGEAQSSFENYGNTDVRLGEYYSNRAAVFAALGQYSTAMDYYNLAAEIGARVPDVDYRARLRLLAMVYLNKAQLYKSQRQGAEAREMCNQALAVSEQATWLSPQDRLLFEIPFRLTDASLLIADAERMATELQPTDRSFAEQSATVRQMLQKADSISSEIAANDGNSGDALNIALAKHLAALANLDLARLCGATTLAKAKSIWSEIAEPQGDANVPALGVLRIRALNYLACIALIECKSARQAAASAKTRDEFDHALAECQRFLNDADRCSSDADQLSTSFAAYPEARFQVLLTRAKVLDLSARMDAEEANRQRRSERTELAEELVVTGRSKVQQAIDKLNDALDTIELPRAMTVGAEDERATYFSQFAPAFDLLVELYVEQGRPREAIQTAERRRSRTFLDQLRAGGVDLYATLPSGDRELVHEEKLLGDRYYTLLAKIRENSSPSLIEQLQDTKSRWIAAHNRLLSASPAYRKLLFDPMVDGAVVADSTRVDDPRWIAEQIGDEDLALVYYLGNGRSYVFACSRRSGIDVYPLQITSEQVGGLGIARGTLAARPLRVDDAKWIVNRVIGGIDVELLSSGRGSGALPQRSVEYRLSDIAMVTEILLPSKLRERIRRQAPAHIVIVPDGALHQLPFEPLTTDSAGKKYLLEELPPIAYAPSLAIYQLLRKAPAIGRQFSLLSVANPKYAEGLESGKFTIDVSSTGSEFAAVCGLMRLHPLPATERESLDVCRAFAKSFGNSARVQSLSGSAASEANVRQQLQDGHFTFLHFAVHGLVDQQYQNLFGALALATPARPTQSDDGFLTLQEILALPSINRCELAILSACQTNCGPQRPLEAGSTIARSFICAGAQRVICSHWSVPDRETASLIAAFVEQATQELADSGVADYAGALREAKLKLRDSGAQPKAWAPFVLVGPPTSDRQATEVVAVMPQK